MRQHRTPTDAYINATFADEDELLRQVAAVGEQLQPGMQVAATEGKLLQLLLRLHGAHRVLEVGSFVGYSSIWMARGLPPEGELITLEKNPKHAALAREHATHSSLPIRVVEGDALASIAQLGGTFDALFIDGEKKSYMRYLDAALPLLRRGALIMADNTLLFGAMAGEPQMQVSAEAIEVMRAFNARLAESDDFIGAMIPTHEGLTIAVKR